MNNIIEAAVLLRSSILSLIKVTKLILLYLTASYKSYMSKRLTSTDGSESKAYIGLNLVLTKTATRRPITKTKLIYTRDLPTKAIQCKTNGNGLVNLLGRQRYKLLAPPVQIN